MTNFERISPKQIILLLAFNRIAIVMLWFYFANQDVWISELIALLYIAILCAPLLFLSKHFPKLTLIEQLQTLTGTLIGKILGALYSGFFLFIAVMDLSLFDNVIKPINLPETPDSAIILLALAVCTYCVYKGLECIARLAEIFAPLVLLTIVFYAVLQIPEMDFRVFLPILSDSNWSQINFFAFLSATRLQEIIVLAMLAPSINKKENINMILFWVAVLITVFSLIIICSSLAGLGLEVAKKTFDPYYLFVKQINIYDFITRIEFLLVAAWIIGMFLKISLVFYLATISTIPVFGLKNRQVLIIPLAIVIFAITFITDILKSVVVFNIIEYYIPYINLLFMFVIPVIALTVFLLKTAAKRKATTHS